MADILSLQEINELLGITDDNTPIVINQPLNSTQRKFCLYDFHSPTKLSQVELRKLKHMHDLCTRDLSSKFAFFLQNIVEMQLHSVDQMSYGEFLMSLSSPTHFNVLSLKPFKENCVLDINPVIAFKLIHSLLGSTLDIETNDFNREFSPLEQKILEQFFPLFEAALKKIWKPISPSFIKTETSPNIYPVLSQNDMVALVVFEVIIGNTSGMISIAYPCDFLEKAFKVIIKKDKKPKLSKKAKKHLENIHVDIDEILIQEPKSLSSINTLKVGDILYFKKNCKEEVC